jgi:NAD(P)-dependent dehydrogenase (short-subunit alcohol dehydrogenase family)
MDRDTNVFVIKTQPALAKRGFFHRLKWHMSKLTERFGYRTALVTGASSGLGLEFARMLRAEGVKVWGASRSPDAAAKAEGWQPVTLDLMQPESVRAAAEQVRREAGVPDILINNAGSGVFAAFTHFPEEEISRQLQLLLEGPILLAREFWPEMLARKSGALVNVSSLAAEFPLPCMSLYSVGKAGLSGFSRALMLESAGRGVQVLDFQPGDYQTAFNRSSLRPGGGEAWEEKLWERNQQLLHDGSLPPQAAADLRRALMHGRSGIVASGGFFQARFAPLAQRLAGPRLTRWALKKYYNL